MRVIVRPRLHNLDLFASALLTTLGLGPLTSGCAGDVVIEDDGEGGAGSVAATGPGSTGSSTASGPGSTSVSASSTTGVTTGGGTGGCQNPQPIYVAGQDTGLDRCDGGQIRRREAIECPTNYPDTNPCCGGCPEGQVCNTQGEVACTCIPACTNDSQCGPDQVCMCGEPAGVCVSASCATGADCGPGGECTTWDSTLGCLYLAFACTTPADTCGGDADCGQAGYFCAVQPDGHRECVQGGCAIGRPFLVGDETRTANLMARSDWRASSITPSIAGLGPELRAELALAWEHTARMEHASIAAFARFSLQLLSLGAPPELVELTNQAMIDETRHARAAFAMAGAYGGAPVGPGRLAIDDALARSLDPLEILRLVVREGCIGETVAAVEASECAERAADPVVREALSGIATDEAAHAELAWRTVRWALATLGPSVIAAVQEEIATAERELASLQVAAPRALDELLLEHGVATARVRTSVRADVLRRVVIPCLGALVEPVASTTEPAARAHA